MKKIIIKSGKINVNAELFDTKTAEAIWKNLPLLAKANTWGDEIYFSIPIKIGEEDPKGIVQLGDLGYWMPGSAFCIFFGQTPASCKGEIKPASPVNVFGKIDLKSIPELKKVKNGEKIEVVRAE